MLLMGTHSSHDRRRASRVPVSIVVELSDEYGFSLHSTQDLSVGGVFFDRSIPYEPGTEVKVSFTVPGRTRTIRCEGEVVRVPSRKDFGMGVRFFKLRPEDRTLLEVFTKRQAKK